MAHSKKCFYKLDGKCCNSVARDKNQTCTDCKDKRTERTVLVKSPKKGVVVA